MVIRVVGDNGDDDSDDNNDSDGDDADVVWLCMRWREMHACTNIW